MRLVNALGKHGIRGKFFLLSMPFLTSFMLISTKHGDLGEFSVSEPRMTTPVPRLSVQQLWILPGWVLFVCLLFCFFKCKQKSKQTNNPISFFILLALTKPNTSTTSTFLLGSSLSMERFTCSPKGISSQLWSPLDLDNCGPQAPHTPSTCFSKRSPQPGLDSLSPPQPRSPRGLGMPNSSSPLPDQEWVLNEC